MATNPTLLAFEAVRGFLRWKSFSCYWSCFDEPRRATLQHAEVETFFMMLTRRDFESSPRIELRREKLKNWYPSSFWLRGAPYVSNVNDVDCNLTDSLLTAKANTSTACIHSDLHFLFREFPSSFSIIVLFIIIIPLKIASLCSWETFFCIAMVKTEIKKVSQIYDVNFLLLDNPIKIHFAHTQLNIT